MKYFLKENSELILREREDEKIEIYRKMLIPM